MSPTAALVDRHGGFLYGGVGYADLFFHAERLIGASFVSSAKAAADKALIAPVLLAPRSGAGADRAGVVGAGGAGAPRGSRRELAPDLLAKRGAEGEGEPLRESPNFVSEDSLSGSYIFFAYGKAKRTAGKKLSGTVKI